MKKTNSSSTPLEYIVYNQLAMDSIKVIDQVIQSKELLKHLSFNELADLKQEGYIALVDAAKRYDSSMGAKFSTYAYYRVVSALNDYLRKNEHTITLPKDSKVELSYVSYDNVTSSNYDSNRSYRGMIKELMALSDIDERSRTILQNKFDINLTDEPLTTSELAEKYHITTQSVNRLNRTALEKMYQAAITA